MKFKKIITLLAFSACVVHSSVTAQSYHVQLGEIRKDKVRPDQFITTDETGNIYMTGAASRLKMLVPLLLFNYYKLDIKHYVKKYNNDLRLLSERPINGVKDGSVSFYSIPYFSSLSMKGISMQTYNIAGSSYVFSSLYREKDKSTQIIASELNLTSGELSNDKVVMTLANEGNQTKKLDTLNVVQSPDNTKTLLLASVSTFNGNKSGTFAAAVMSNDKKILWSKEFQLPKEKGGMSYRDVALSNDGVVYLFAVTKKGFKTQPKLTLFSVSADKSGFTTKDLKFGNTIVTDAKMTLDANNEPTFIGFYKDGERKRVYDGMFQGKTDEKGNVIFTSKKEFSLDYFSEVATEREKKALERKEAKGKDLGESDEFIIGDMIRTEDGGVVLVSELYRSFLMQRLTSASSNTYTNSIYYVHVYGDVVVTKIDASGNIVFMKKIAKKNFYNSAFDEMPVAKDYKLVTMNNNYYVLYNADEDNQKNEHARWTQSAYRGTVYVSKISSKGELVKTQLLDKAKLDKYTFSPTSDIIKVAENKLVILLKKGVGISKKARLGMITFDYSSEK